MINWDILPVHLLVYLLLCGSVTKVISETSQNPSSLAINQPSDFTTDSAAETTPSPGTSACFVNAEGAEVYCRNGGTCAGNTNATGCRCGSLYAGSDCGQLDLNVPIKDVFETGISFIWSSEFEFLGYVSVFTRTPLDENSVLSIEDVPSNLSDTITVNGLQPDNREYVVCIVHMDYMGNISNINMSALIDGNILDNTNANCGITVTPFDQLGPFTLAAWGIAIAIVLTVILLLIIRGEFLTSNKFFFSMPKYIFMPFLVTGRERLTPWIGIYREQ